MSCIMVSRIRLRACLGKGKTCAGKLNRVFPFKFRESPLCKIGGRKGQVRHKSLLHGAAMEGKRKPPFSRQEKRAVTLTHDQAIHYPLILTIRVLTAA